MPCLRIFLEAASANRLGHNIIDPTESQLATAGDHSGSYALSNLRNRGRVKRHEDGQMQLTSGERGETRTTAARGGADDKISVASDSSRRAIMVRQTVVVELGESE